MRLKWIARHLQRDSWIYVSNLLNEQPQTPPQAQEGLLLHPWDAGGEGGVGSRNSFWAGCSSRPGVKPAVSNSTRTSACPRWRNRSASRDSVLRSSVRMTGMPSS